MKALTVDDKQRVRLKAFKPGDVVACQDNGDGSITLTPVKAVTTERPYDPHLYDDMDDEALRERQELEAATANTDVGTEERDRA